jgi:hypothetical protein
VTGKAGKISVLAQVSLAVRGEFGSGVE